MFNDLQAMLLVKVIQEEWERLVARQRLLAEAYRYRSQQRAARRGKRISAQEMLRRAYAPISRIQRRMPLPPYHYPPAHHHPHYR